MENPFLRLQPIPPQEVDPYRPAEIPQPAVPWFGIHEVNTLTLRAHMSQCASTQAFIHEQYASWEKKYRDADTEADAVWSRKYLAHKETAQSRLNKYGEWEDNMPTEQQAKALTNCDPEFLAAVRIRDDCRYNRDIWQGYAKAASTKRMMIACLSGLDREEMKFLAME